MTKSTDLIKLEADLLLWRKALHSLTPGGSEYMSPELCVDFVRRARNSQHELIVKLMRQVRELEAKKQVAIKLGPFDGLVSKLIVITGK